VDELIAALKRARPYVADLPIVGDADLEIIDDVLSRALASPGDGSSADADTHRSAGWPVLADRERLAFLIRCSIGECIIGPSHAFHAAEFIISEGREEDPPAASVSPGMETLQASECTKEGDQ